MVVFCKVVCVELAEDDGNAHVVFEWSRGNPTVHDEVPLVLKVAHDVDEEVLQEVVEDGNPVVVDGNRVVHVVLSLEVVHGNHVVHVVISCEVVRGNHVVPNVV